MKRLKKKRPKQFNMLDGPGSFTTYAEETKKADKLKQQINESNQGRKSD